MGKMWWQRFNAPESQIQKNSDRKDKSTYEIEGKMGKISIHQILLSLKKTVLTTVSKSTLQILFHTMENRAPLWKVMAKKRHQRWRYFEDFADFADSADSADFADLADFANFGNLYIYSQDFMKRGANLSDI